MSDRSARGQWSSLALLVVLSSCTESGERCVPGSTAHCLCGPATNGFQVCADDGTFEVCDCSEAGADSVVHAGEIDAGPEPRRQGEPDPRSITVGRGTGLSDDDDAGTDQMKMTQPPGRPCDNFARTATVTASAGAAVYRGIQPVAKNVTDGTGLFWSTGGPPAWIELDLEQAETVELIRVFTRANPNELLFRVSIADDDEDFRPVFEDWGDPMPQTFEMPGTPWPCHPAAVDEIELLPTRVRRVRLDVLQSRAPGGWLWKTDVNEIEVGTRCTPIGLTRCEVP